MFPKSYRFSDKEFWKIGNYQLVPIRYEDRLDIMKWRNEQIYHLRQHKLLTEEDQENYFSKVVEMLFHQDYPNQLLFSYLENGKCIGYGGLVHINWIDKNAEISFVINTELENQYFEFHWKTYLSILQKIAFEELALHKIYTYAFDLRPRLYNALSDSGFTHESTLKEHCYFGGKFLDVLYHSKINTLKLRYATQEDIDITYQWAKDPIIRKFSFNQNEIIKEEHYNWFSKKINDEDCYYFILEDVLHNPLGSIRLDVKNNEGLISYLIDSDYFGRGLGTLILQLIEQKIKEDDLPVDKLIGYVLKVNVASVKIFEKLQYHCTEDKESLKFYKEL